MSTAIKLNRVLCPVDFSEHSRRALRHALAIARRNHSELTVLHVEDVILASARADVSLLTPLLRSPASELRAFLEAMRSAVGRSSNTCIVTASVSRSREVQR